MPTGASGASLIVFALLGTPLLQATRPVDRFEFTEVHMGMPVRVVLYAPHKVAAETAARAAFGRIAALDGMLSDYRRDSELNRLSQKSGVAVGVSPELFDVLERALQIARITDGAFDPTVGPLTVVWREARRTGRLPDAAALSLARSRVGWRHIELDASTRSVRLRRSGMQLDLGGIAKGYVLQQALLVLEAHGIPQALLAAGGDIVAGAAPPGRKGWQVDVSRADVAFVERSGALSRAALATSGSTAQFFEAGGVRYSHVIDPRSGLGVTHRLTVSVIAPDGATADALATAIGVLGREGLDRVRKAFPDVLIAVSPGASSADDDAGEQSPARPTPRAAPRAGSNGPRARRATSLPRRRPAPGPAPRAHMARRRSSRCA